MRLATRVVAGLVVSFLLAVPSARAQGYLAPALGVSFGNPSANGRANFVADFGWLSRTDPIGVELDFMYAPSFFGNEGPFGENRVVTVMGNVMLAGGEGHGFGFRHRGGGSVRPYASGGIGLVHEVATDPHSREFTNDDLGVNIGFGVMTFSHRGIGIRGDIRYFRNLVGSDSESAVDFGSFHFWRAGVGIVLGF